MFFASQSVAWVWFATQRPYELPLAIHPIPIPSVERLVAPSPSRGSRNEPAGSNPHRDMLHAAIIPERDTIGLPAGNGTCNAGAPQCSYKNSRIRFALSASAYLGWRP